MMQWLKQSTSITIRIGPFLDEADGKTAETALTISQADIRLSKNGGDFAQSNDSGGATHDENGWYYLTLDATDTGTLGRLVVAIHESGALPVWQEYMVFPANAYDSLVSGSDYLDAEVATIVSATANKVADHVIRRSFQNACDSSDGDTKTGRSLLGAIAKLVNKIAASSGTLTVYEDDDSTSLFTQTITTDETANPVTELDTA